MMGNNPMYVTGSIATSVSLSCQIWLDTAAFTRERNHSNAISVKRYLEANRIFPNIHEFMSKKRKEKLLNAIYAEKQDFCTKCHWPNIRTKSIQLFLTRLTKVDFWIEKLYNKICLKYVKSKTQKNHSNFSSTSLLSSQTSHYTLQFAMTTTYSF